MGKLNRKSLWLLVALALALIGWLAWRTLAQPGLPAGVATGNGRIEATEIDIAALSGGRIDRIGVNEGDSVTRDAVLVQMDIVQLTAQKRQAEAELRRAVIGVETARSLVDQAQAQLAASKANVEQAAAAADASAQRLSRAERMSPGSTISQQTLDDDRAGDRQARAGLASAEAAQAASRAGVTSAEAQVVDAEAAVDAARAAIDAIASSIKDATLTAPRDARVQYLVAQEGEIVAAGARILNLVDLSDVYLTFFLPTSQAGRVQVGSEARLVMDAAPDVVIPATVSYVADVAQFTPKTVETLDEREKLMFRIRARVDPELLRKYVSYVKTGLPGSAYVLIDKDAEWPAFLGNLVK